MAKNRLAELVMEERGRADDRQQLVNGKMSFGDATKTYLERLDADSSIKPRTKAHREECLKAIIKTWSGNPHGRTRQNGPLLPWPGPSYSYCKEG